MKTGFFTVLCGLCWIGTSLAGTQQPSSTGAGEGQRTAPLLKGLVELGFPLTTDRPLARTYFNQGLVLAYGFNHAETGGPLSRRL